MLQREKALTKFNILLVSYLFNVQVISYKRFLECTLIQWRLSIYPYCTQVADGTFFMKSPVVNKQVVIFLACFNRKVIDSLPLQ